MSENFEPKIIGFMCKWCTYGAADLAGVCRMHYPSNIVPIRLMCSGGLEPSYILKAFKEGADGVFIGGCHFGDCHYQTGNYHTNKRIALLKTLLEEMGIDKRRIRLEWISAAEGAKFVRTVEEFVKEIKKLGPISIKKGA